MSTKAAISNNIVIPNPQVLFALHRLLEQAVNRINISEVLLVSRLKPPVQFVFCAHLTTNMCDHYLTLVDAPAFSGVSSEHAGLKTPRLQLPAC